MVLSVSPIRTVQDFEPLEYYEITVTSKIDQAVSFYIAGTLVASEPFTAEETRKIILEDPVKTEGERELRVVGATAGEWRGRVAMTGTQNVISFVDEDGKPALVHGVYLNLDKPFLMNVKRTKSEYYSSYTLAGRWVLEVYLKVDATTFRYEIIDLATIKKDITLTLPKLTEVMVATKLDLSVVWGGITRGTSAIDFIVGRVATALGFKEYPSLATYIVNYLFNVAPYPPHAWELKDSTLTIYYRITPETIGIAPIILAFIIIVAFLAVTAVAFVSWAVVEKAEADKARAEAQAKIAEEEESAIAKWLEYAEERGLTAQETMRGLEAIASSYEQMAKNVAPTPTEVITTWVVPLAVIGLVIVIVIAIIWYVTRRPA